MNSEIVYQVTFTRNADNRFYGRFPTVEEAIKVQEQLHKEHKDIIKNIKVTKVTTTRIEEDICTL